MKPIKSLFTTLYQTITEPKAYRHLLSRSFSFIILYSGFWISLMAIATATLWLNQSYPQLLESTQTTLQSLQTNYPQNLTITISPENLTINPPEPVTISFIEPLPSNETIDHLAIIDPNTYSESILEKQALILATDNSLAIRTVPIDTFQVFSYDQIVTQKETITHQLVTDFVTQAQASLKTLKPIIPALVIFLTILGFLVTNGVFVLLYAIVTQSLGTLLKRPLTYKASLKLGFYTIVPTGIISFIHHAANLTPLPYQHTLLFIGLNLIAILTFPKLTPKPSNQT